MNDKQLSKYLALLLRHEPQQLGLELDSAGWTSVPVLIQRMQQNGLPVDLDRIRQVVQTNNKQRFQLSPDEQRIKANQGHSISVDLGLPALEPPTVLFHGTATRFLEAIRKEGLIKGKRHHVHLSADKKTAALVGQRHGTLVILEVAANRMYQDKYTFYRSDNGVWLTDYVPPQYFKQVDIQEA